MSSNNKFCPECGSENSKDAVFCASCGKKFNVPSQRLGDDTPADFQQTQNQQKMLQPDSNQYVPNQGKELNIPQQGEVSGLGDASIKMMTNPENYATRLLADPDAPSSSYLVFIRAVVFSAIIYMTFARDEYFNEIYASELAQVLAGTEITVEQARDIYSVGFPIFYIVFILGYWYIGSWILGLLVKGSLHENSPLRINLSYSMRQLNGYRQTPRIIGDLVILVITFLFPPAIYFLIGITIIRPITQVLFAVILWRGMGEHVGYFGSVHKIIAGIIIFFEIWGFL